ncbi:unnamed protein product [Spirodela intermedia]|uniref:Uncharacterized protein n=1 Tax=Spirodela intermedia TaxID=51605 RepID=A0A7I8J8J6_SPIIN|nr:unnamed protein product [Spirodela intermedia]CAA6666075.1 unnamed protein product [Spirodela intermedia]
MAFGGLFPHCFRCCLFIFLLNVQVIYAADADEACRGGVANGECCKVINDAINTGGCACVCRQLKNFNHSKLTQDCNRSWCLRCGICSCSSGVDGSFAY